jgi:hypothetical protein
MPTEDKSQSVYQWVCYHLFEPFQAFYQTQCNIWESCYSPTSYDSNNLKIIIKKKLDLLECHLSKQMNPKGFISFVQDFINISSG